MSLTSLTNLSLQLVESATDDEPDPDNPFAEFGVGTVIQVVEEGEEDEDTIPSWSSENPLEYNRVRHWIRDAVLGGSWQGLESLVTGFTKAWGDRWYTEHEQFPSLEQLHGDEGFIGGAQWLPFSTADIPTVFTTEIDGTQMFASVDPMEGITFTEVFEPAADSFQQQIRQGSTGRAPDSFQDPDAVPESRVRDVPLDAADRAKFGGAETVQTGGQEVELDAADRAKFGGAATATVDQPGTEKSIQDVLRENPELRHAANTDPLGGVAPHISQEELAERLGQAQPSSGGRRGGGGGGMRRDIAFDREMLLDATRDRWRDWFIQDPPDAKVERIVDAYVREATSFWRKKGGQLDFTTFMENQLKETTRYAEIFRFKDPAVSEDQFLAEFRQPIGQLGLAGSIEQDQIRRAVTSGGSPAGQMNRIARSREGRRQSGFTRQLAETVAGLGAGARV